MAVVLLAKTILCILLVSFLCKILGYSGHIYYEHLMTSND